MTSRQAKQQEDTYFKVMRILHNTPDITQRDLAEKLGVSVSGLNYCLKALIDKGWVKIQNFRKKQDGLCLHSASSRHRAKGSAHQHILAAQDA
jgi:predicted transcriptional regulator